MTATPDPGTRASGTDAARGGASVGFALFDTALGVCGIAWGASGVVGIQLPEADAGGTRERLAGRFPTATEAPPPERVQASIQAIVAALAGRRADLSSIPLDMGAVTPFRRQVYEAARSIESGTTSSYGELAKRLGKPGAARAIGQAMGNNPFPIVVPCHRVLAAGGKIGGFSADGGAATKARMLAIEGAILDAEAPPAAVSPIVPSSLPFDADAAVEHLRDADPVLGALIEDAGPFTMQLTGATSVFGSLAQAVVYQQLNGRAAATIYGRVQALFDHGEITPEGVLGATDEALRGAGLSRAKLASLRDLSLRVVDGELPTLAETRDMDDDAIIGRLVAVRGIGRWTAEMFLMFTLGRPDVLPVDDFGVRKGFAVAFGLAESPSRQELADHGARWSPYRTVASWYLWRAAETRTPEG